MDYSWKILKSILHEYKEQALEKNQPFGSTFEFLEMEILKKEQETAAEQRDVDKEGEAILNIPMTLSVASTIKKRKRVKKLRPDILLKKRSVLQGKKKVGKNQRGGPQKGELDKRESKGEKKGERKLKGKRYIDQNQWEKLLKSRELTLFSRHRDNG
uniref:Uncharacterized protein n=1 Tax=Micrurus surinamensis TaxID=129470 RepID=A0A2D4NQS7_MICSU